MMCQHCPATALLFLVLCFLITGVQLAQKVFLPVFICVSEGFSQAFSCTVHAWSLACVHSSPARSSLCLVPSSPSGSHAQAQPRAGFRTWNIPVCLRSSQSWGMLAMGKRGAPLGLWLAKQVTPRTPTRAGLGQRGWQLPHSYCGGSGLLQLPEQGWLHLLLQ